MTNRPIPRTDLPSAIERVETMIGPDGSRRPVVFLDYDGVLTPIVSHPDLALLDGTMRATVSRLAKVTTVAVVSGRDTDDVRGKIAVDGVYYAGSHGFDIIGPDGTAVLDPRLERFAAYRSSLDRAADRIRRAIADIAGAHVEVKRYAIAIHFRQTDPADEPHIRAAVEAVASDHPDLRVTTGKKIFEYRPDIEWDKGRALAWIMDAIEPDDTDAVAIYLGDDTTDEDAFRQIATTGIGIVVGRDGPPTLARFALADPDEVGRFLDELVALLGPEPDQPTDG